MARGCPGLPGLHALGPTSVKLSYLLILGIAPVVGDWSNALELIPNPSSVGLVRQPGLDVEHGPARVWVLHHWPRVDGVVGQLLDGCSETILPSGRPHHPTVGGDGGKEGQGKHDEKEHPDDSVPPADQWQLLNTGSRLSKHSTRVQHIMELLC